jgi:hypothetical protein
VQSLCQLTLSVSLSESDSNTSSTVSWSGMFSPYSHTAKCTVMKFGTKKKPICSDSVIQASALLGLSHVIAPRGKGLKCSFEDRPNYEPPVQKRHTVLKQNEGHLPLVPYCTNQRIKICIHSFRLPLIAYELNHHSIRARSQHPHEI